MIRTLRNRAWRISASTFRLSSARRAKGTIFTTSAPVRTQAAKISRSFPSDGVLTVSCQDTITCVLPCRLRIRDLRRPIARAPSASSISTKSASSAMACSKSAIFAFFVISLDGWTPSGTDLSYFRRQVTIIRTRGAARRAASISRGRSPSSIMSMRSSTASAA